MIYNCPYSSSDGGLSENGDDHHHHHDQLSTFTGEATSSADGGTAKQGAAPTPTIQADPSASRLSLSPPSLVGGSGISNSTSSPSDNVFPTVSASDPLITSFSSSTESSTAASFNLISQNRAWLTMKLQTNLPSSPSRQNAAVIGPNIAGGVIGGIIGLTAIVVACFLLFKARQRKRMAPSSEFFPVTSDPASFSRLTTRLDDPNDRPPPFTQGNFSTSMYEKFDGRIAATSVML